MHSYLNYRNHFSQEAFWKKVKGAAISASRDLIFSALILYYTLQDPDLPGWARTKIYGALGYLIFPMDAVPDWWPGGYVDDTAVIALVLSTVAMHITSDTQGKARSKLQEWFGDGSAGATPVT